MTARSVTRFLRLLSLSSRLAFCFMVSLVGVGCAGWLQPSTEVAIDTGGHPSVEERAELDLAMGAESKRFYAGPEIAVGRSFRHASPYVTIADEGGYEGGGPIRIAAGLRVGMTMLTAKEADPIVAVGPTCRIGFRLLHPSDGNDLYIGPTLATEVVTDSNPKGGVYGRFSAGFAFRWAFTDETEDRRVRSLGL